MIDYKTEFYEKIKPNYQEFDERLPEYWMQTYSDRLDRIHHFLFGIIRNTEKYNVDYIIDLHKHLSILDIGCGSGRALSYFKKLGVLHVLGIEPSSLAVSRTKLSKDEIVNCEFSEWESDRKFDVVYIEQALSHMEFPAHCLLKAKEHCKDTGILVVEEPNDNNSLQRYIVDKKLYKDKYWLVDDHLSYFDHKTLSDLVEDCGFTVVELQGTWPMEWFQISGDNYLGDDDNGKIVHEKRFDILKSLDQDQRLKLARCFADMNIGRDILLYAINKKRDVSKYRIFTNKK